MRFTRWCSRSNWCWIGGDQKLYIPSTLNIDLILWHTQLIVCAENVKSWFKSLVFPLTFQAYILPHTLNCMCVSLFKFHILILEQFKCCPKRPALPTHIKVWVSFELFGALYMCISASHVHNTYVICSILNNNANFVLLL